MKRVKTKSILVVEDNPSVSRLCGEVLINSGYQVDIATKSNIARETLALKEYDLYIIDISSPTARGFDLYKWLVEKQPKQAERVIIISNNTFQELTRNIITVLDTQFLEKPFTADELKTVVDDYFTGK